MKKFFIISILALNSVFIFAQKGIPPFIVTDIYGQKHDLFGDYLDQGKYVMLDFFSVGCGGCQTLSPIINEVYLDYGCNCGDIVFLAIDGWAYDSKVWNFTFDYNLGFPAISGFEGGGNGIVNDFNVAYTPYEIMISPDREIVMDNDLSIMQATDLATYLDNLGIANGVCAESNFLYFSLNTDSDSLVAKINKSAQTVEIEMPSQKENTTFRPFFRASGNSTVFVNGIEQTNGVSTPDFSSGSVDYEIVAENGTSKTWTVSLTEPTGVENFANQYKLISETKSNITLSIPKTSNRNISVDILTMQGQAIYTETHNNRSNSEIQISTEYLKSGIYFLRISDEKSITGLKFVKN